MIIKLTKKQYEVLLVLVTGASNKEISEKLNVAKRTVESHVAQLMANSDSSNRSEVISKYLNNPEIFKIYNTVREESKYIHIIELFKSGKYQTTDIATMVDTSYNYANTVINRYRKGLIKV